MSTTTIAVEGMTCAGCASSVRAELSHLPGVSDVSIDLAGGTVTIASIRPVDPDAVRAAVEEAGYQLAS
ncbi:heavy-metal-associated domain-containing protein [Mycolicibacterium obuense]|jgi:copper chaperone CopZ|uniref:Cation-transporting ATPase n=1 Tax=Mycolicibacterium obuense TaxID=1807 RepID=A0A0J6WGX4_9MYCO|nr:heavy metal-associated domain-containing protein [Mycolicibacterium obuense]KKF02355.1 cation-transporting ATPase [Mycolicibacterium obuense]KMO81283.1 Copper chaperone CopZ [Mycolicibacterium obuense]TDL06450.1 heavy-metal-associated domain-containing protein [Mycolicibacterium obuense]